MMNTRQQRILQLNANRSKDKVMRPLLMHSRTQMCDILLIQEPWRNPFSHTTHNPDRDTWDLVYAASPDTRSCIFINKKRIAQDSWSVIHLEEDICGIEVRIGGRGEMEGELNRLQDEETETQQIVVLSVYNPSPIGEEQGPVLGKLQELYRTRDIKQTIIMGDFNLHHLMWTGHGYHHRHQAAEHLLDFIHTNSLELVTPAGAITFDNGYAQSTIDLAICASDLAASLESCLIDDDLDHDSDHTATVVSFNVMLTRPKTKPRRQWKSTDQDVLCSTFMEEAEKRGLHGQASQIATKMDIDNLMRDTITAINRAVDKATPIARPCSRSKPGFNSECKEACRAARRRRRLWKQTRNAQDWEAYEEARNHKGKVLKQAAAKEFRRQIEEAAKSDT